MLAMAMAPALRGAFPDSSTNAEMKLSAKMAAQIRPIPAQNLARLVLPLNEKRRVGEVCLVNYPSLLGGLTGRWWRVIRRNLPAARRGRCRSVAQDAPGFSASRKRCETCTSSL